MSGIHFKFTTVVAFTFVSVIILFLLVYFFVIHQKTPIPHTPPKPHVAYKINIDSLDIHQGKVAHNQNLALLLSPYVSAQMIDKIAKTTTSVFDVKKLKAGQPFARISKKDSTRKTLYFIYELNEIEFVVYDFRDSLRVYRDKKKVTTRVKTASGQITSSLWNAFSEGKLDMNLGMHMADIYAWTVDFYGLQKGDGFKVVYEEILVDSIPIGSNKILASLFYSSGKNYYAFYFEQSGKGDYFDDQSQSLRRSFLKAPLKFSRISSKFTKSRMHPILRIARPHYGVDYAAPRGTPVVSLGHGRVIEAGWHGGYGRKISIRHNAVYTTSYAHLSKIEPGIQPGVQVNQGEVIGYVGSGGLSTGAHLDFRVYKNGIPTNPLTMESPPANPVEKVNVPNYQKMVAKMKQRLDSIR